MRKRGCWRRRRERGWLGLIGWVAICGRVGRILGLCSRSSPSGRLDGKTRLRRPTRCQFKPPPPPPNRVRNTPPSRATATPGFPPLQPLGRSGDLGQMIAIQRLQQLAQALMAIILLIPHVLMIPHLALLVQRERDERVHRLRHSQHPWRVFLLLLVDDRRRRVGHNFRRQRA